MSKLKMMNLKSAVILSNSEMKLVGGGGTCYYDGDCPDDHTCFGSNGNEGICGPDARYSKPGDKIGPCVGKSRGAECTGVYSNGQYFFGTCQSFMASQLFCSTLP